MTPPNNLFEQSSHTPATRNRLAKGPLATLQLVQRGTSDLRRVALQDLLGEVVPHHRAFQVGSPSLTAAHSSFLTSTWESRNSEAGFENEHKGEGNEHVLKEDANMMQVEFTKKRKEDEKKKDMQTCDRILEDNAHILVGSEWRVNLSGT